MAQQTTKEILKLVEYQIEQIFTEVEKIKKIIELPMMR